MAIECHSCFQWLMPTIDQFRDAWPEVELDLASGFAFAPLPALARGDLDLVVTSDPVDLAGITYVPLFTYEAMLAVANQHPLASKPYMVPQDLIDQTLITYRWNAIAWTSSPASWNRPTSSRRPCALRS